MTQWIYLTDMAPQATIMNTQTGEMRRIMSSAVKDRAPAGLRRFLLDEVNDGLFRETGEVVPLTESLIDDLEESYHRPNAWNYDWPHFQIESAADIDPSMRERVASRLTAMMGQHPYEFEITGLQRRYLMYYSDGNYKSQQRFERLVPSPDSSPFRRNGDLRRKYNWIWNSNMRDAKVPFPSEQQGLYGDLRPCLYTGPAWVVRFLLDGQDVLLERCRVYVDDDANFICSDWCQRHDYSSYGDGINLQTGLYSFDSWVTGPCLTKNTESGKFKPKTAVFKRTAVRELMKRMPVAVPTYEATFAKAQAAVAQYAKAAAVKVEPTKPTVDAGPITADVMAEAMAEVERILQEKAQAAAEAAASVAPVPTTIERPTIGRAANVNGGAGGFLFRYTKAGESGGCPVIGVSMLYQGQDYLNCSLTDVFYEESSEEYIIVDEASETGFWYGETHPSEADDSSDVEKLNDHWWLYSAAVYYRDNLMPSAVETVLLEA